MIPRIVWLASYPKSGNTWFRVFLTAILGEMGSGDPNINTLVGTPMASNRELFDQGAGLSSSDLLPEEIEALRPEVYRRMAAQADQILYLKIHDACTRSPDGGWLFPPDVTKGVVYLIRNPLDVAVSFARHSGISLEGSVAALCRADYVLGRIKGGMLQQFPQLQMDWSGHVLSWTASPHRVCVLRFEDMKQAPFATFKRAVEFLELDRTDPEIRMAIAASDFERLKGQEEADWFKEKPMECAQFFRKGMVGDFRNHLTPEQIRNVTACHREVMIRFGYLDQAGDLLC